VAGFCGHGNEHPRSHKRRRFTWFDERLLDSQGLCSMELL
jgi:hypothetical protein